MANRTIITNMFRVFHPHLVEPQAYPGQAPKYNLVMAFPMSGRMPPEIADASTDTAPIMTALNEVCMEEWGVDFATAPASRGIQFPPKWKNGNEDWQKDDNGNFLVGTPKEASVGMFMLNVKNIDPIGTVDHTGKNNIAPSAVYGGCWARAQLEISAYVNKEKASIIAITITNVQKCYDDANLGGGGVTQTATQAFADMAITDSNIKVGADQAGFTAPAQTAAPVMPGQPAQTAAPVYQMTDKAMGNTREVLTAGEWTDELLLQHGLMIEVNQPTTPAAPVMPGQAYLTPQV